MDDSMEKVQCIQELVRATRLIVGLIDVPLHGLLLLAMAVWLQSDASCLDQSEMAGADVAASSVETYQQSGN